MNTNIVVSLDTRRPKKDGSYPLVLRLGHNERTTSLPLSISLHRNEWDEKSRCVKKNYTGSNSVARINNMIQKQRADALDIILKLNESGQLQSMSVLDVRNRISNQTATSSFFVFSKQIIEDLKASNRIGTAKSYQCALNVFSAYNGNKDLQFSQVNYNFLTRFENHHLSKGNGYNSLAVYMRSIRALFNRAVKAGLVERSYYPFNDYTIKTQPTEKRALEWDFLKKIISLDLPRSHPLYDARNYFVGSYMMYGMNFTDMAYLKKDNLINGRIQYRRRKTSKLYDIKITGPLEEMLTYYVGLNDDSVYVFPILKREGVFSNYKEIQWARKRYNKKLKEIAKRCSIDTNLTSYVSRHSFATQAMMQKVPVNAISAMLGHSSLKTTEVYLKSLPSNILDDYNAGIIQRP